MTIPCVEFNTDIVHIGAATQFAKFSSFLASVLGGGGSIFLWVSLCFVFDKIRWRWVAVELMVASFLQALSFTWFASSLCQSNDCAMYYGSRSNLIACVMWAFAAMILFCKAPMVRDPSTLPPQIDTPRLRNNETTDNRAEII